ncbi:MAG: biotin synthase BioB [Bacteroidales bacterium]|nr:biotin synthase BioB [Bacteroidales bacterium]
MIQKLKDRVLSGEHINKSEALTLSQCSDKEMLYKAAHEITRYYLGNLFDTCSIINAKSGNCTENCKWCAQSKHYRTKADIYPLVSEEEVLRHAHNSEKYEITRFSMVTSGKRISKNDLSKICSTFRRIKKETGLKCCASMGLLNKEVLSALKESGVENYHCNIETAPSYFKELCTSHTTEEKVKTLRAAREAGMRICSGGIIGMGESMAQRIEMALFLRELEVYSIPLNLLQPIKGTPLEHSRALSEEELLTSIALFRFINPKAFLRFSGGRALMSPDVQRKALYIGINAAIMGDLLTTSASQAAEDRILFSTAGYSLSENTDWIK